jgi:putative oligomerization/nucleic acid binding protein
VVADVLDENELAWDADALNETLCTTYGVETLAYRVETPGESPSVEETVQPQEAVGPDVLDQIGKLGELRDRGILTEDEFSAKRLTCSYAYNAKADLAALATSTPTQDSGCVARPIKGASLVISQNGKVVVRKTTNAHGIALVSVKGSGRAFTVTVTSRTPTTGCP